MSSLQIARTHLDSSEDHDPISSFLELKQLGDKSFRCDALWQPQQERGVYGGQLVSQSLLAATRCVSSDYSVNSIHCHFLFGADPSVPISYSVESMRQGKTYCTLMVKGWQKGRWIVSAICSFQRPEHGDVYEKMAARPGISQETRSAFLAHAEQLRRFPVEVLTAGSRPVADGLTEDLFWMRLKHMPSDDTPFKQCVMAFLSDLNILSTVARAVGLVRGVPPPNRLSMISSLDHSVWFYEQDFDCTDWLMFVMISPLAGMGRGIVHGRIYTQSGKLIATATQEGVVRADTAGPPAVAAKL